MKNLTLRSVLGTETEREALVNAVTEYTQELHRRAEESKAQQEAEIAAKLESGEYIMIDGRLFDAEIYYRNHPQENR